MKLFNLLLLVFCFCACSVDELIEAPGPLFNIVDHKNLQFEYIYDRDDIVLPTEELFLKTQDLELNEINYSGYYHQDSTTFQVFTGLTSVSANNFLNHNFLPIRYEDGNYYEYRGKYNFSSIIEHSEVIILKDNIKKGDTWQSVVPTENDEPITFYFEVVEMHPSYNEFEIEYTNVYQIRETFANNANLDHDYISMYFYNLENGIIRREIPTFVSGTYGPIIFNKIK